MNHTTPNHQQLVELWMEKHFRDVPCAVFFQPLGDGDRISLFQEHLGIVCGTGMGNIINSDVFILPTPDPVPLVHGLPQEKWGFVMSWNGSEFTSHN